MSRLRFGLTMANLDTMMTAAAMVAHWHTCPNCGPRWLPKPRPIPIVPGPPEYLTGPYALGPGEQ